MLSAPAALTCILLFLGAANLAIAAILLPAVEWFVLLPQRIGRVKTALTPALDIYATFERFIDRILSEFGETAGEAARTVRVEMPNSSLDLIATSAPLAAIHGLKTRNVFGGVGQNPQVQAIRQGVDIVLACPGRLEDLIQQGHVDLGQVEVTILDEAEQMADLGFLTAVRRADLPTEIRTVERGETIPLGPAGASGGARHL